MFDEGVGIKSRECAGIQIRPEYIMPSIMPSPTAFSPPPPVPLHLWIGLSNCDRRGFAAPSTSEQPTLRKPTARLVKEYPPPRLVCQLSRLQVAENTLVEESMRVL